MTRNSLLQALAMAMIMVLALVLPQGPVQAEPVEISIIHTNDVHGNAMETEGSKLGYAKLKTFVDQKKAENPNTLVLDAGDTLHGTTFATISSGQSMLKLMGLVGYDAMTAGNHDFNYGYQALQKLAEGYDVPILVANVYVEKTDQPAFQENMMVEVGGVKVGIFGLATPETQTKSSPLNTQGLVFKDVAEIAKAQAAELRAQGAEVVICLSHLGLDGESDVTDDDLANAVGDLDVIVSGHSHTVLDKGLVYNGVLIVQTGEHTKNIGEVTLTIDKGEVTQKEARLHAYEDLAGLEADADVLAEIAAVEEANRPYLEQVLGTTEADLDGERETNRTSETNLGNLITDVMRSVTGADVAMTNGGGIRASIPAGEITMEEVVTTFPFTNYLVLIEVTGQTLVDALEHGVGAYPETAGKFPQVSGMTFRFDPKQEPGQRVFDVKIGGQDLDPAKTYTLATNDFMAIGGDGYEMFKEAVILEEHALLSEVLAAFIRENTPIKPEVEGRITIGDKPASEPVDPVVPGSFTDVSGHWAEDAILQAYDKGLMVGMTDSLFAPDTGVTRAMFVAVLSRLDGAEVAQTQTSDFLDVDKDAWYADPVAWAVTKGIVVGVGDKMFAPEKEITRQEMAVMMKRYLTDYQGLTLAQKETLVFADDAVISDWAKGDVYDIVSAGLLFGMEDQSFGPLASSTRAQLAAVSVRLAEVLEANPAPEETPALAA